MWANSTVDNTSHEEMQFQEVEEPEQQNESVLSFASTTGMGVNRVICTIVFIIKQYYFFIIFTKAIFRTEELSMSSKDF